MSYPRPFLPDQRAKGNAEARKQMGKYLRGRIKAEENFIATRGHKATDDLDTEYSTGSLVFLELVRSDLIAGGHMTAEDFSE